ncbi:MAG: hypothetical protein GY842_27925 [bacterium]|nr:hypothetical protein [bacterium]
MLKRLNKLPRKLRWPIKWAVVVAVYFLVCFPYPHLFLRHVTRWRNPNVLVDAQAPALKPLLAELGNGAAMDEDPQQVMARVESLVRERVPYAFDWETWGVADYLPTLDEVFAEGREDCDGRAVVAASLMQALGHEAELVSDFTHVWVRTAHGEFMGPRAHPALAATEHGLRVDWGWRLVADYVDALGYGVAVFPLMREMILLATVWLMLLGRERNWPAAFCGALLMIGGLLVMRVGGHPLLGPVRWLQVIGGLQLIAGMGSLVCTADRRARR